MCELYRKIIFNDETRIKFLKDREFLPNSKLCTKLNSIGEQYGSEMKETLKRKPKTWFKQRYYCNKIFTISKKGCQIWQSICKENLIFTYIDRNGKNNSGLSLCEILKFVWY